MGGRGASLLLAGALGCAGDAADKSAPLTRSERLDPASCAGCHPEHHREWSGSMHAYAAEDPVFRAMNAYGQRVTGGELGDFCVQCHAPVALAEGATTDGTDLDAVDPALRGVTCTACHQVDAVTGDHNHALSWVPDGRFRGPLDQPLATPAHGHRQSPLHDRDAPESAAMCGACHDVVTPAGVPLERSFAEWRDSIYAETGAGQLQTCGACHMPGRSGPAASVDGAPERRIHSHAMPGVDVALTDFPEAETQRALVQDALDSTVWLQLDVFDYGVGTGVNVTLDNIAAGHGFPSGAAHDRRAWVSLVARDADGAVLWSSGVVDAQTPLRTAIAADPQLWWLGDWVRDESGADAHMFWEVATVEAAALPAPSRFSPGEAGYVEAHQTRTFDLGAVAPATVEAAVHIRPVALELLDLLVASGDLDPAVRDRMPTFTLAGSQVVWTAPADTGER